MFEVLPEPADDVVTIRVGRGSLDGYRKLYSLLRRKTEEFGRVHVYEEVTDWTALIFFTHFHGVLPDLRYGPDFDIGRYAAVGDSMWAKLLFDCWKAICPAWPVAPEEMRYYNTAERDVAADWVAMRSTSTDGAPGRLPNE